MTTVIEKEPDSEFELVNFNKSPNIKVNALLKNEALNMTTILGIVRNRRFSKDTFAALKENISRKKYIEFL